METIYQESDGYELLTKGYDLIIRMGSDETTVGMLPINPEMPKIIASKLKELGKNPSDFFCVCGRPIRNGARNAVEKALESIHINIKENRNEQLSEIEELEIVHDYYNAMQDYNEQFNRMMEDESNDGVNLPKKPKEIDLNQYPIAVLYCEAENYEFSGNDRKSSAGTEAKKVLEENGSDGMDEANEILENWLPETAIWD